MDASLFCSNIFETGVNDMWKFLMSALFLDPLANERSMRIQKEIPINNRSDQFRLLIRNLGEMKL